MANQSFDFSSALEIVQEAGRVASIDYPKGEFLFLVKGEAIVESIESCYGDPSKQGVHIVADTIYLHKNDGQLVPWNPTQTELFSKWIKL